MGGRGSSSKKAQSIRSQLNRAYSDKNYYSKRSGLSNTARDLMLKNTEKINQLKNELEKPQYNKTAMVVGQIVLSQLKKCSQQKS